ncbi:MAG TPA: DUF5663 domain-containing protein [Candidatus Saccharimonadales bacterium]|nr:DUF5663 domain-containing protein [Candidatus Saccharimonadales bacterium]
MDFSRYIKELGIDQLPEAEQQQILQEMFKTLQGRIGLRLSQELTPEQMKEVEAASARGEQEGVDTLNRVYPNYAQMCQEELDKLTDDMK